MPRIDIELTSSRPDGSWTWRAAGARQPKGALDGTLLHDGAKVGEVVRAEVVIDVEGMTVMSTQQVKQKKADSDRLEIIGPPVRDNEQGVTTDRAPRGGRDGGREGSRPPRDRGGPGGPGWDRDRGGPGGPGRDRDRGGPGGPRRERPGPGLSRPQGPVRPRGDGERSGTGRPRPEGDRAGPAPVRPRADGERAERTERSRPPRERTASRAESPPPAPKPRPKRIHAGRAHRDAALASLPPQERLIAEQVLRGGVPAVRQALEEQNAAARAAGAPQVPAAAIVALAEQLAPRLRAAEWRDRAEAAIAQLDEVGLRDLRALVVGSDTGGRDEPSRELAGKLRQALDDRSGKQRDAWLAEITEALDAGRVVRALRSSARPPEPGVRLPAELAERLSGAAGEALSADVAPDRWSAVLEAVTTSPVRRTVQPRGVPAELPPEMLSAARVLAERVPGIAALVGAPPPPAVGTRRPPPPGQRPAPRPTPPPPRAAVAPAAPAAEPAGTPDGPAPGTVAAGEPPSPEAEQHLPVVEEVSAGSEG